MSLLVATFHWTTTTTTNSTSVSHLIVGIRGQSPRHRHHVVAWDPHILHLGGELEEWYLLAHLVWVLRHGVVD